MIDQYKVAFDMETIADARPVINKLKLELANFRKIVLLDHHHKPGTKAVIPGVLSYVRFHLSFLLRVTVLGQEPMETKRRSDYAGCWNISGFPRERFGGH